MNPCAFNFVTNEIIAFTKAMLMESALSTGDFHMSYEEARPFITEAIMGRDEFSLPTASLVHVDGKSDVTAFVGYLVDACLWTLMVKGVILFEDGKICVTQTGMDQYAEDSCDKPDRDADKLDKIAYDNADRIKLDLKNISDNWQRERHEESARRISDIHLWCQTCMSPQQHSDAFNQAVYGRISGIERNVHEAICKRLMKVHGPKWWRMGVPTTVRQSCVSLAEMHPDDDVHPSCYMTLINLSETIVSSWNDFGLSGSKSSFESCFRDFNKLRNVIMHPLKGKEIRDSDLACVDALLNKLAPLLVAG